MSATSTVLPSSSRGSTGFLVRRWTTSPLGLMEIDGLPLIMAPGRRHAAALDLGEEGGQAEVVVLGPDVERMVVALAQRIRRPRNRWAVCSAWTVGSRASSGVIDRPAGVDVGGIAQGREQLWDHLVPGRVLGQAVVDPGLVAVGAVALPGRADLEQVAELDPPELDEFGLAPCSRSTSFTRLSGSVSARNRRICSGVGCSPVRSSETLRRNAASLAGGLGGTLSDSSRLNSSSSMKFRRGSLREVEAQARD